MKYTEQISEIADYFKRNIKSEDKFKIGVEFEHFIINLDTLEAVKYYGIDGVEDTLKKLKENGWKAKYEKDYLLALSKNGMNISLEPGSQFELSIDANKEIQNIEEKYLDFLEEITPILEKKNQGLITVGYQPESKIEDIHMIPKKRYDYMYNYFKTRGKHAHNMMKGTASIQVTVDFKSEEDYIKKFRVANALSPIMYAMFDNSPYFEGNLWDEYCLRTDIWENCDSDRCGIVEKALEDSFDYEKYAEYVLNRPVIFIDDGKGIRYTGQVLYKDIFNKNYSIEELEHVLTMFFPDVRTKKFIELRMADAVPYPLNFSVVALWKGIMYDEKSLSKIYYELKDIDIEDIKTAKREIIDNGLQGKLKGRSIEKLSKLIVSIAMEGLNKEEKQYLIPLKEMIDKGETPASKTKLKIKLGKRKALEWCIVNGKRGINDEIKASS